MSRFSKTIERRWTKPNNTEQVLNAVARFRIGEVFTAHQVMEAMSFKQRPHINRVANILSMLVHDGYARLVSKGKEKRYILVDDQSSTADDPTP